MVTDARLLACVQRVRVRCELFLGLLTQIQDDLAAMNQVGDPPEGMVIDSSGLFPFDSVDWHPRFGFCYVGGHMGDRLSLHAMCDGRRLTQGARLEDLIVLTPCSWRVWALGKKLNRPMLFGT